MQQVLAGSPERVIKKRGETYYCISLEHKVTTGPDCDGS